MDKSFGMQGQITKSVLIINRGNFMTKYFLKLIEYFIYILGL